MAATRDNLNLFGIDLANLYHRWRAGWAEALTWPQAAWLGVEEPVELIHADGRKTLHLGDTGRPAPATRPPRHTAILLPQDIILHRRLLLPRMPEADLEAAMLLEVDALNPFPPEKLAWGARRRWTADGRWDIDLAITSRDFVEQQLERLPPDPAHRNPEVWGDTPRGPIVLRGYGESLRQSRTRRNQTLVLGLLALLTALLIALAALPVAWQAARLAQAEASLAELQQQASNALGQREQLVRLNTLASRIMPPPNGTASPVELLERISALLPEDAWLDRFDLQDGTLQISGHASNGSAVLSTFSQAPAFRTARTTAPIVRDARLGKDRFVIEIRLNGTEPTP